LPDCSCPFSDIVISLLLPAPLTRLSKNIVLSVSCPARNWPLCRLDSLLLEYFISLPTWVPAYIISSLARLFQIFWVFITVCRFNKMYFHLVFPLGFSKLSCGALRISLSIINAPDADYWRVIFSSPSLHHAPSLVDEMAAPFAKCSLLRVSITHRLLPPYVSLWASFWSRLKRHYSDDCWQAASPKYWLISLYYLPEASFGRLPHLFPLYLWQCYSERFDIDAIINLTAAVPPILSHAYRVLNRTDFISSPCRVSDIIGFLPTNELSRAYSRAAAFDCQSGLVPSSSAVTSTGRLLTEHISVFMPSPCRGVLIVSEII